MSDDSIELFQKVKNVLSCKSDEFIHFVLSSLPKYAIEFIKIIVNTDNQMKNFIQKEVKTGRNTLIECTQYIKFENIQAILDKYVKFPENTAYCTRKHIILTVVEEETQTGIKKTIVDNNYNKINKKWLVYMDGDKDNRLFNLETQQFDNCCDVMRTHYVNRDECAMIVKTLEDVQDAANRTDKMGAGHERAGYYI